MSFTLSILRADDLLNLRVRCVDLRIETDASGNARLMPSSDADAFLVFIFPPQTITERAYYDATKTYKAPDPNDGGKYEDAPPAPPIIGSPDAPGDVPARIGGQSRLVFRLGPTARATGIELSIEGLLDWSTLELVVTPIADIAEDADATTRASAPPIRAPSMLETAIELPYRLIISPSHRAHWQHAANIVSHGGRAELWHTATTRAADDGSLVLTDAQHPEPLRAIWSPDFSPNNPPTFGDDDPALILTSMAPYDRHQIVILTSDFHNYLTKQQLAYVPTPFQAELLMLSPLGGWLKSRGGWAPPYARVSRRIRPDFPWRDIINRIVQGSVRLNDLPIVAGRNAAGLLELFGGVAGGAQVAPVQPAPDAAPPAPDRATFALSNLPIGGISGFSSAAAAIGVGGVKIVLPELGAQLDLSEWVHVATQGRDHYVRIVYEGRLYPFGHRAALIKITERKFRNFKLPDGSTTPVAYMVQKMFIVVRERVRDFSDAPLMALTDDGRAMPLKRVRLTTTVTPTITYPYAPPPAIGKNGVFWIMVEEATGDADFRFHGIGTDIAGDEIDFNAALIFVPNSRCSVLADLNATRTAYAQSGDRRALHTTGQRITLAPREPGSTEETTSVETDALFFETQKPTGNTLTADQVRAQFFTPRMYKARVNIPAAAAIVGARTATTIAYYEDYLANDFAGAGGVFAKVVKEGPANSEGFPTLVGDAIGAAFSAERGGGIATPNMSITSLSRKHGPLAGDVAQAAANTFDPTKFFPKGAPDAGKLFGSFSLEDIIKLPGGGQILDKDAPKMRVRTEPAPPAGTRIVADLDWHPNVSDVDAGLVKFIASDHGAGAVLDITARIETLVTAAAGNGSTTQINGSLRNFRVEFVDAVWVHVDEFAFASKSGQKPDVKVRLNTTQPVTFVGDLEFVETLRQLIPPGLLGDGPSLDINAERVHAGFSVAIPPASVGVFSLSNIRLGAFVELPFTEGRPIFDFAFALRQDPFTLAVAILGGTGFFHVQLDTDGVRLLEAAFEFGAIAALDIGIASGSVHILAGIYFKLEKKEPGGNLEATLSGYLRVGGEMQVLIVRVSVEFILSFTYHDGKATGRATLTVSIDIAFFSVSVELSVERSFGKDGGDPAFDQMLPSPNLWSEYAGAFA